MPPRKRRTRAVSRAKPKAPSGDEGKDLTLEERRAKMELFLKDFDVHVKDRIAKMRAEAKRNCQKIESLYRLELTKLPKHIRDMKRSEFLKLGGTISAVSMHEAEELVGTLSATIDSKLSCQRLRTVSKTSSTCATIEEEEEETTTKKKPTRRGKAVLGDASNMPPPPPPTTGRTRRATARTTQNASYQTPFGRAGGKTTCDTPLFTPRFDPRLPNTPGTVLRKQREGEKTVTSVVKYSMAGSPLAPEGPVMPDVFLPVGDGQMIALNEANVDEVMDNLDEQTKSTLEIVHKRLAAMFAK
ncbi:borealin-like [Lingula anatina]|uniref:Borealin-like n=1 Tax=Lingula anatina TaxID=7574 RepID=A0A1S3H485_LINAN|nr:borealin-like [Lingula anatina]|eukprot:XP_013380772.1 borealin-like [Lingula anatina]